MNITPVKIPTVNPASKEAWRQWLRFKEQWCTTDKVSGEAIFFNAFQAGAEWARKEALREAADAVRRNAGDEDENGISEGVNNWPDAAARTYSFATHEAIEAIRALAEGVSDGQQ